MCAMANVTAWLFKGCLVLAAFSLVAHFIADATCGSLETGAARFCTPTSAGRTTSIGELATNSLHTGVETPTISSLILPMPLWVVFIEMNFNPFFPFVSPPVQPPKRFSIA
jgi:hypothetical protein